MWLKKSRKKQCSFIFHLLPHVYCKELSPVSLFIKYVLQQIFPESFSAYNDNR